MSEIKANSIIECQNSICNEKVRLYHDYYGSLHLCTFKTPKGSQFRYSGGIKKCHIC